MFCFSVCFFFTSFIQMSLLVNFLTLINAMSTSLYLLSAYFVVNCSTILSLLSSNKLHYLDNKLIFYFAFLGKKPKGTAPEVIDELRSVEVNEGENATLTVTISGKPTPTVEWMKDGFRVKESRRIKPALEDGVASLTIKQARDEDRGEYKCVIKNEFGKCESSCKLKVIIPKRPEFKVKMKPVSGTEGGEARFEVEVEGFPKPEIEWYFGSTKIVGDRRVQIIDEEETDTYSLVISDLKLADSGSYKCVAINDAGKATLRADLNVKERQFAPEIEAPVEGIIVKEGEEITFEVVVKGNPKPEIDWFKDERMILETSKRDIKKRGDSYQVMVLSSTLDDTGIYKCVAGNKLGQTSKTIDVQVKRKYRMKCIE